MLFRTARLSRTTSCPERSEEHTSELQSQSNLVCRLLLEKKKKKQPSSAQATIKQHTNWARADLHRMMGFALPLDASATDARLQSSFRVRTCPAVRKTYAI